MKQKTYWCVVCGAMSTPEKRLAFATEWECMNCLGKSSPESGVRYAAAALLGQVDEILAVVEKHEKA